MERADEQSMLSRRAETDYMLPQLVSKHGAEYTRKLTELLVQRDTEDVDGCTAPQ